MNRTRSWLPSLCFVLFLSLVSIPGLVRGTGVCCLGSGECVLVDSEHECEALPGCPMWQGPGSCDPNPCPCCHTQPCCLPDGSCACLWEVECAEAGGILQHAIGCEAVTCTYGACCFDDGTCAVVLEPSDCLETSGYYAGDGTICDTDPCPPAVACCFGNGSCEPRPPIRCLYFGGTLPGDETCDPNPCEPPLPQGACCRTQGGCVYAASQEECEALPGCEVWMGEVSCEEIECCTCGPRPCCLPDGTCECLGDLECAEREGVLQLGEAACELIECLVPTAPTTWSGLRLLYR